MQLHGRHLTLLLLDRDDDTVATDVRSAADEGLGRPCGVDTAIFASTIALPRVVTAVNEAGDVVVIPEQHERAVLATTLREVLPMALEKCLSLHVVGTGSSETDSTQSAAAALQSAATLFRTAVLSPPKCVSLGRLRHGQGGASAEAAQQKLQQALASVKEQPASVCVVVQVLAAKVSGVTVMK
mgnify:CR=1 FL=1